MLSIIANLRVLRILGTHDFEWFTIEVTLIIWSNNSLVNLFQNSNIHLFFICKYWIVQILSTYRKCRFWCCLSSKNLLKMINNLIIVCIFEFKATLEERWHSFWPAYAKKPRVPCFSSWDYSLRLAVNKLTKTLLNNNMSFITAIIW